MGKAERRFEKRVEKSANTQRGGDSRSKTPKSDQARENYRRELHGNLSRKK